MRIIQVFYIDEYCVKRITDRVKTDKPVDVFLKDRGHLVWNGEKFTITPGYNVEELPLPTANSKE